MGLEDSSISMLEIAKRLAEKGVRLEDLPTPEQVAFREKVRERLVQEGIDPDKPAVPKRQEYVVGFRFDGRNVLLLRKNRPPWQAGRLNGVGGKVEPNEGCALAMIREYKEEVGCDCMNPWFYRICLTGRNFILHVFSSEGTISIPPERFGPDGLARNDVGEILTIVPWDKLPDDAIPNLHWMVPLCRDDEIAGPIEISEERAY